MVSLTKRKFNKGMNLNEFFKKNENLKKALAKKLAKNFDIDDFLNYFIENNTDEVEPMVKEALSENNFPKDTDWKDVLWQLKGSNKVDFRQWLDIAINKGYITGEDIPDKLNDFIKSNRDYKMYSKERKSLLNLSIELLETPEEWYERKGKAKELAKVLEERYEPDYIGERLKDGELLYHAYNPTLIAFQDVAREAGLPKEASTENTKYKVTPELVISFLEFADYLTTIMNNDKEQLDNLIANRNQAINEIYLMPQTLTFTAVKVTILDTIPEWEERNQILANPKRAVELLGKKVQENFDPILVGDMLSTRDMLEQPQNTCKYKVQEKLQEEEFPKQATAYNVDYDARAIMLMPEEYIAEQLIQFLQKDYVAINSFIYLSQEQFNQIWKLPVFINTLDFKITLKQTREEWEKENMEDEQEQENEEYEY